MKISLPGAEVVLVKLPRAKKGEERKRKEEKNDTLGSIVVERNAREERGSERWAWWWTKTKGLTSLRSLDLSLSIEIGLK